MPDDDPDQLVRVRRETLLTILTGIPVAGPTLTGAFSELHGAVNAAAEDAGQECGMCRVPLATGRCPHVIIAEGRVTMTERKWRELVAELRDLRNLEGQQEGTRTSQTPDGFTDAAWHVDAIADSGVGYTAERHWHLTCSWCPWFGVGPTKADVVGQYREHEAERFAEAERERLAAGRG